MRLLLDTNILIWSLTETENLPRRARSAIEDDDNERLFSAVCIWAIAIKTVLGEVGFTLDPGNVFALAIDAGFRELTITSAAAARVATLPLYHRDPFDRLLVAQAIDEDALLLTADAALAAYAPHIMLAG